MSSNNTKDESQWERKGLQRTRDIIQQYLHDFEFRLVPRTLKAHYLNGYQFFHYCGMDYDQVTTRDVRAWIAFLSEKGYKNKSINFKFGCIRSFYRYCDEEGLISMNPTLNINLSRLNRFGDEPIKAIDNPTVRRLLELTKDNPLEQAIISVLYATGVRISELANIRLEDLDLENRRILIRQGKGQKDRVVLFTCECAEHLRKYLATTDNPYIFSLSSNHSLGQGWVRDRFKKYSNDLNLNIRVTPHIMRHTFASILAQRDMPVECIQVLMGHRRIATAQYYARLNGRTQKKQYDYYE